jgi:hypothetical protein
MDAKGLDLLVVFELTLVGSCPDVVQLIWPYWVAWTWQNSTIGD